MYITVRPAYGTDYNSQKDALAAWNAGKDFTIIDTQWAGCKINKADVDDPSLPKLNGVTIRFAKDRKVAVIQIKH